MSVKVGSSGRLPWSLAVFSIVGGAVAIVLAVLYAARSGDTSYIISHAGLSPFITTAYAVVGALVASRHPRNPIGWIFVAVGVLAAGQVLAGAYYFYADFVADTLPGVTLARWLTHWLWIPATMLPTVFVWLLFPDGQLLSSRWRLVLWLAALGLAGMTLVPALHPGPLEDLGMESNPYGITGAAGILDVIGGFAQLLMGIGFVGALAAFVIRYRRSRGIERMQMKWLVYTTALMVVSFVVGALVWAAFPDERLAEEFSIGLTNLSVLGIAVAATIAILRYRLYDIDLVVNRTLVYGVLSVGVVAIYVLVVGGLGALFQSREGFKHLFATGLVAVMFQPMRERLQRGVNRLFYGRRDEPLVALSHLGHRLEAAIAPEVVLPTLVETIAQTLKLPYVAISLRTGEDFKIAARCGDEVADALTLPLIYQGETVGQLIAGPRGDGESFNQTDRRLLENIALQAGPSVHAVQLTAVLQRARQQLVTAREEERRRLRRDLHDGLGATLAALNLEAGVLRRAIRSDPARAEALVDEFRVDIRAAIDDIRRLVYELRPPALDQLGLVAAVRLQAAQCSRPEDRRTDGHDDALLHVMVEAPEELPPLPAAVEVAAYRIAQEALTNVVHHARARQCLVRLAMADALTVEVVDDGVGVTAACGESGSVGLLSMRERATELGGTCVVEPAPEGGTRVLASLPLGEL